MTVSRHHAEWLSLTETSGPFLSMPVLMRVFPQGLEPRNTAKASALREAYEDWLDRRGKNPAVHTAWVRHVLDNILEYPADYIAEGQAIPPGLEAVMSNFAETCRPDLVLRRPASPSPRPGGEGRGEAGSSQKPLLLIQIYPHSQDLAKPLAGKLWKASPGTRMTELLHATDAPLGLVTNGEQWMLVYAPRGETSGFASWFADLWMQEHITLRAFHSLLHLRRFTGVAPDDTLPALYAQSAKDQQEVTEQLGYQVRRAVEMLVQAFDRADADSGRKLLADVTEKSLYDAALTLMMRLVFLFCAEERKLLLLGDPMFDQHYAASTLGDLLRERADQHGEELLERRHDAWCRLLATFRAVHAGVEHETMRLPPYGGTLFDPDRYPFLEGRAPGSRWQRTPAKPVPINNRVVLHLLEALQILRVKIPGGGPAEARRLSFRSLGIEQIGHVYEGLLDHTAKRARETVLGLSGGRDTEPEVELSRLEDLRAKGADALIEFLKEETGRSEKTLRKALQFPVAPEVTRLKSKSEASRERDLPSLAAPKRSEGASDRDHQLLLACGNDPLLAKRIRPFAALIREDDFGQLVVIHEGSVFVTRGSDRRSTGTHYTPRSLTEPIVQYTLEPLAYTGPAEGKPKDQWQLKTAREILSLKVCDMAMGSGAFLVQTCRYLAERLVEAWEIAEKANPGKFLSTPEGEFSTGEPTERILPADPAERLLVARRYAADRCLYGVDINPMAVEMAKLSLWLITLQRDRPFEFLDHALKCGDSLLGISDLKQIENFSLRPGERQVTFATANLFRYVEQAGQKRRELEQLPSNDPAQIQTKNRLHAEAEAATAKVKALADCLIALELRGLDGEAYEYQRTDEAENVQLLMKRDAEASLKPGASASNPQISTLNLQSHAREQLHGRCPFHWAVEFPEVLARGGFDAFVGNPPFMHGSRITGTFGEDYREFLVAHLARGQRGNADFCTYFLLRLTILLCERATSGIVATSTIAQGDTREVGLDQITADSFEIFRGVSSVPWPGTASLEVAHLWIHRGQWGGEFILDGQQVEGITAFLTPKSSAPAKPFGLAANLNRSFTGSKLDAIGFVLLPGKADELIAKNPKNRDVVLPYLNGDDITSRPDQSPSRWAINFHDWPLDRTLPAGWNAAGPQQREAWLRNGSVPQDYPGKVAADYPECLRIVESLVKPVRLKNNREQYRRYWWHYAEKRPALYSTIRGLPRTLIHPLTSKHHALVYSRTDIVFSQMVVILTLGDWSDYAVVQSELHWEWVLRFGNKLETRPQYTPSDVFDTFPFPIAESNVSAQLSALGKAFYESREETCATRQEGLTKTYNRFHDRSEQSADIARLRALHVDMDQAVAGAYGWSDLALGHGFHATKQGERYTICDAARRTVLDRLLALNHQRYDEEVKAGLHEKRAKKSKPQQRTKGRTTTAVTRALPAGFRFPASDPAIYAVNLVTAILSESAGDLPWIHLRDAFVLATRPDLMKRFAAREDPANAKAWADRWNEQATPALLPRALKALYPRNIFITRTGSDFAFQLPDGPKAAASEDVGYDAWLALRTAIHLNGQPAPLPESEAWIEDVRQLVTA